MLAVDLLGSGKNPPWPDDARFDFTMDVDAVREVVEQAGEPVHLVGHSYGGLLALSVGRVVPPRVRTVTVYDPVAFGVLHDPADAPGLADLAKAEQNPVFLDDAKGGSAEWFESFVDYWNGPGSFRALPKASQEGFVRVGRKVYYEVRSLLSDRTPASAYRALTMPVAIVGGERSPVAAQRVRAILAAAIPESELVTIAGAGHMGPLTHATEFHRAVARTLARAA